MTDFGKLIRCFDELGIELHESDRYVAPSRAGDVKVGKDLSMVVGKYVVVFEFNDSESLQNIQVTL